MHQWHMHAAPCPQACDVPVCMRMSCMTAREAAAVPVWLRVTPRRANGQRGRTVPLQWPPTPQQRPMCCRAVSEAELLIAQRRERLVQKQRSRLLQPRPKARLKSALHGGSDGKFLSLAGASRSTVARTSLAARHRWECALRRVLIMNRVLRALQESSY
jgi:hypothetical protein